ncbi:MAG: hypothetical protein ACK4UN_04915 [Limisphaerales bacterium]
MSTAPENNEPATDYLSVLAEIRALLLRNGYDLQASFVDDAATRLKAGESMGILTSNELWGGSGSVADCSPPGDDNREHCRLMSELSSLMVRDGIADRRVQEKGFAFWYWVTNNKV